MKELAVFCVVWIIGAAVGEFLFGLNGVPWTMVYGLFIGRVSALASGMKT